MTDIIMHTGVDDLWLHAARVIRKSQRQQMSVGVLMPNPNELARFDDYLWVADPLSFIPHRASSSASLGKETAVLAVTLSELPDADVLLQLSPVVPADFAAHSGRFKKVIDPVSAIDPGLTGGRERFRQYRRLGLKANIIDLKAPI